MRKKHLIIVAYVVIAVGIGTILGHRFMNTKDIVQLKEIAGLVLEKGYDSEDIEDLLEDIPQKRIHAKWGKPDGHLSGFWGEIWFLNEGKDGRITLYYDEDGKVDDVVVDSAPGKTTEK